MVSVTKLREVRQSDRKRKRNRAKTDNKAMSEGNTDWDFSLWLFLSRCPLTGLTVSWTQSVTISLSTAAKLNITAGEGGRKKKDLSTQALSYASRGLIINKTNYSQ